jgi:tRNA pseudouridine38-40 synthase
MSRYFLYLGYNGTNYCGWQTQPNGLAIQQVIEKALATLLRVPTPIVGAGRTDAGVHARQMMAHFDAEITKMSEFVERINRILPYDIVIYDIREVAPDAHARFDAESRLYRYYISTQKDPFLYPFKYKVHGTMDVDRMSKCAEVLFEYEDFTSFSKLHTDVKTNNCNILRAEWEQRDTDLIFTIKANRFLRNMVRAVVGTLLEAGRGRLDEQGMRAVIEAKNRGAAGFSVPGHALFLEEIEYPDHMFLTMVD